MDLSSLDNTLPPALADAERDMGEKFRAAALNITTMYKNSLQYTKQAYQVGYSAALTDVLSKVQADIGAGADAATALQRLMDWSEARQAAIKAFEAEDSEAPVPPRAQSVAASVSQRNVTPQRPSSAPIPDVRTRRDAPGPSSLRNVAMDADEPSASSSSHLNVRNPASATSILQRSPSEALTVNANVPSSSPLPSPSGQRPIATQPLRTQRTVPRVPSSGSVPTSSSFNFSLPTSLSIPSLELPPASGPAQSGPIGSKRPIMDAEMAEGPSTPLRGSGRHSSKRRSMGLGAPDGDEKERGSERRRSRRGGGLGGGGGAHAPSPL